MRRRVIPVLLLENGALVKTKRFKKPTYIGDPVNSVKLFNDLEVDEIAVLDIAVSKQGTSPDYDLLSDLTSEAFMPLAYGGGVRNIDQMAQIFSLGVEKIAVNSPLLHSYSLIEQGARRYGSQSIIASVDVKNGLFGDKLVYDHVYKRKTKLGVVEHCSALEQAGAGEILLNSVDGDGMLSGYDLDLLDSVLAAVDIPIVVCGGASGLGCFSEAAKRGADVAAGSLFVFSGGNGGVLVNYPSQEKLNEIL